MEIKPYLRKVNYYETDKMQVVHHSNYIRYYEEARAYFLESIGFPYQVIEEKGVMIPVLGVNSNYLKFAKYGDLLRIEMEVAFFNGVRMNVDYKIYNQDNILINTGSTAHCFLDNNYLVIRLQTHYQDLYSALKKFTK